MSFDRKAAFEHASRVADRRSPSERRKSDINLRGAYLEVLGELAETSENLDQLEAQLEDFGSRYELGN